MPNFSKSIPRPLPVTIIALECFTGLIIDVHDQGFESPHKSTTRQYKTEIKKRKPVKLKRRSLSEVIQD